MSRRHIPVGFELSGGVVSVSCRLMRSEHCGFVGRFSGRMKATTSISRDQELKVSYIWTDIGTYSLECEI